MSAKHRPRRQAGLLVLIVLVCCGSGAASGFLSQIKSLVQDEPSAVATGDFNGDGKADVAVANLDSNTISVLLSNGDGTFQPAVNYPVGAGPDAVAVSDLNRDGKLDLVIAERFGNLPGHSGNTIGVLLGNGDGTFQADVSYPVGLDPDSVVVRDFNGDGKLDVTVANFGSLPSPGSLTVLLGRGDGTFQIPGIEDLNIIPGPASIAAGDFNGDGKLDIAMANLGDTLVSVLLGNGDGTFHPPTILDFTSFPESVAVGDLNGDGNLDIVAANSGEYNVSVFLGNGDGTFQADVKYPSVYDPMSVVIGDFNGDGKADLAVANSYLTNDVSVLLGRGDGTFRAALNYQAGYVPVAVAVGDVTGHGPPDLVVANSEGGTISLLLNTLGTTMRLSSSVNPSTVGQPVTFTALVKAPQKKGIVPTGSVTFDDGNTPLGKVTLANGMASLSTSTLSAGSHTIRAVYTGDNTFNPNRARNLVQVVNP